MEGLFPMVGMLLEEDLQLSNPLWGVPGLKEAALPKVLPSSGAVTHPQVDKGPALLPQLGTPERVQSSL